MTQEEKKLLLKDLCARLPHGVIYHRNDGANIELREIDVKNGTLNYTDNIVVRECKPYLRPMSSMTEEETKTYKTLQDTACSYHYEFGDIVDDSLYFDNDVSLDYLNSIHIDYRSLIPMDLALEAKEGMYK